jgi:hypothetical protein
LVAVDRECPLVLDALGIGHPLVSVLGRHLAERQSVLEEVDVPTEVLGRSGESGGDFGEPRSAPATVQGLVNSLTARVFHSAVDGLDGVAETVEACGFGK